MPTSRHAEPRPAPDAPILITMGEPSGIGPEVAVAAFKSLGGRVGARKLRLVGDGAIFRACGASDAEIDDIGVKVIRKPGIADPANGPAIVGAIDHTVRAALEGSAAAVVTGPIHKASLIQSGFAFPGHTEYLAHLTGATRAVMMLAGADLRVVPLSIHVALSKAPSLVTKDAIIETGEIVLSALARDFAIANPRLAIAGLNPHAGEDGKIGPEENAIIRPAADALRATGHHVAGPLPPDTMFHAEARAQYDAALCMYHDQALIPLKTLSFWDGVNITLGLPIVRTSPDHGTALDIAGKGKADPRSMIAAIRLAAAMADARAH